MKEISAPELKVLQDSGEDIQLIDVREAWERDFSSIGGIHIPPSQLLNNLHHIERDKKVIFYCRSGLRSRSAIYFLEDQHGFTNLINLAGGILAWSEEVDREVRKY